MLRHRAGVISVLGALLIAGCGGDDDGGGGGLDCSQYEACGGDPTGEWTFVDACFDDNFDPEVESCPTATASVMNVAVTGSVTVDTDMTYAIDFTTTGDVVLSLPESCLNGLTCAQVSDAAQVDCTDNDDGGCDCQDMIEETTQETGTWEVDGTTLSTTTGGETDEATFCVDGDVMKLRPQDQEGPMATLVLQR